MISKKAWVWMAALILVATSGASPEAKRDKRLFEHRHEARSEALQQRKFQVSLKRLVQEHLDQERAKLRDFWNQPRRVVQAQRRFPAGGPRDLQDNEPAHIPSLRLFGPRAEKQTSPPEARP